MRLSDFLTKDEIQAAMKIYDDNRHTSQVHNKLVEFLEPKMEVINKKLGQENSCSYLAYACEFVFSVPGDLRANHV